MVYNINLDNEDLMRLVIELDCALAMTCDTLANALNKTAEEVREDVYDGLADNLTDSWTDGYGHWDDEGEKASQMEVL